MTGLFNWLRVAGNAAFIYAYLNFFQRFVDAIIYLRICKADQMVLDEEFLVQRFKMLIPFCVLVGLPFILSVLLLAGVNAKHCITCKIWCYGETILMALQLAVYGFKSNHIAAVYGILFCLHIVIGFCGVHLVYNSLINFNSNNFETLYIKGTRTTIDKIRKAVAMKSAAIVFTGQGSGLKIALNNSIMLSVEEHDEKEQIPSPLSDLLPPLYSECVLPME